LHERGGPFVLSHSGVRHVGAGPKQRG
jgi:hypothetical protein